jgi:hypothetical protein
MLRSQRTDTIIPGIAVPGRSWKRVPVWYCMATKSCGGCSCLRTCSLVAEMPNFWFSASSSVAVIQGTQHTMGVIPQ